MATSSNGHLFVAIEGSVAASVLHHIRMDTPQAVGDFADFTTIRTRDGRHSIDHHVAWGHLHGKHAGLLLLSPQYPHHLGQIIKQTLCQGWRVTALVDRSETRKTWGYLPHPEKHGHAWAHNTNAYFVRSSRQPYSWGIHPRLNPRSAALNIVALEANPGTPRPTAPGTQPQSKQRPSVFAEVAD